MTASLHGTFPKWQVNRLRPKFLLISGDLTNAFPSDEDLAVGARQVADFKEALRELDPHIPLILQPGNHDIGQQPTADDVARYLIAGHY